MEMMSKKSILGIVIGVIAVVIGMQQKSYDRIVLCKILNSFFGGVHYIFLGGYTGMVINLASIFTSGVYWYRNKKNKNNLTEVADNG